MGKWRETWIIDACMLNTSTILGESSMISEGLKPTTDVILSLI